MDAEIELAGENEKDQDSKEAETEVSKCQTHVSFYQGITPFLKYLINNSIFQV